MSGLVGTATRLLALAAGIVLATVAFDFLGVFALIGGSALLVIAARVRSPATALIVGSGAGLFLLLLLRVLSMCDSTIEDCTPEVETVLLMAWLGVLVVAGLATTVLVSRARPA